MVAVVILPNFVPELIFEVAMVEAAIIVDDIATIMVPDGITVSVIMLSDIMLSDIMVSVIMVSDIMVSVIMVSGIAIVGVMMTTGVGCSCGTM
jgi:hypothetical protein